MNTKLAKTVVVIELDDKFIRAYTRARRRRGFNKLLRWGAVLVLSYYIYEFLEGRYKKGM